MMLFRKSIPLVLLCSALLALAGCSKPPQEKQDGAQTALVSAQEAQAEVYAPSSWVEAQEAMTRAEAELQVQGEKKLGVLRSYGKANELLTDAQALAEKARAEAVAEKERVRLETESLLAAAQTELQAAKDMLATVPKGKDTRAEIETMQREIADLETALAEASGLVRAEEYQRARAQIELVSAKVVAIKNDLQPALAKVKTIQ